jgi:hypothetical protein
MLKAYQHGTKYQAWILMDLQWQVNKIFSSWNQ